jgi:C1A family cysteine protease
MTTMRGMGWRPELPDQQDATFARRYKATWKRQRAERASLRVKVNHIRDQGETGSCVGQSIAYAVDIVHNGNTVHSARFGYYEARKVDGFEKVDDGAYIRSGFKALFNVGNPPESAFKFSERTINKAPPKSAYSAAARWKGAYVSCDSLDDILDAIQLGHPVVFGVTCYESMFSREVDQTGIFPIRPEGKVIGGHALCAAEFDIINRRVSGPNSWGMWGAKGWYSMPFDYFTNIGEYVDDVWALVREQ